MHEVPRDQVLLIGIALVLVGSVLALNFRGVGAWHARRAIGSVMRAEPLLRRIQPWKSMYRQPVEDRVRNQVTVTRIVGLMFAAVGVFFLLAAFGVVGPVYSN